MTTSITHVEAVRLTLVKMQPEFAAALPPQIPAERFVRTVMTAVQLEPKLLGADRKSLLSSCMRAAQDGLMLDGREAALVTYGDKVQYLPMVGGILKKLRQSGQLLSISANVVYEKDEFDYEREVGLAVKQWYKIEKLRFGSGDTDTADYKDNGIVTGWFAAVADA